MPTSAGVAVALEVSSVLPPIDSPVPAVTAPKFPVGAFAPTPQQREDAVPQFPSGTAHRLTSHDPKLVSPDPSFSEDTSVVVDREQFSTDYLNVDGTHTTELSMQPLNIRSDAGIWVPVSTSVLYPDLGGALVVDNPLHPTFAKQVGSMSLYSIDDGSYSVSFGLLDSAASSLAGSKVRRSSEGANQANYREVFPGTDVSFDVQPGQVKETLVLRGVPTVASWA